jgi:hypothetical protein
MGFLGQKISHKKRIRICVIMLVVGLVLIILSIEEQKERTIYPWEKYEIDNGAYYEDGNLTTWWVKQDFECSYNIQIGEDEQFTKVIYNEILNVTDCIVAEGHCLYVKNIILPGDSEFKYMRVRYSLPGGDFVEP